MLLLWKDKDYWVYKGFTQKKDFTSYFASNPAGKTVQLAGIKCCCHLLLTDCRPLLLQVHLRSTTM